MKYFKYLFAFMLFVVAGSCSKDTTVTPDPGPSSAEAKEALLNSTKIGVYQDSKEVYTFDKEKHQLYINPSQNTFRIQDDSGAKYVELRLNEMPSGENTTKATLTNNSGVDIPTPNNVVLLKSDDQRIWIWSDETQTGFILPQIPR